LQRATERIALFAVCVKEQGAIRFWPQGVKRKTKKSLFALFNIYQLMHLYEANESNNSIFEK